MKIKRKI